MSDTNEKDNSGSDELCVANVTDGTGVLIADNYSATWVSIIFTCRACKKQYNDSLHTFNYYGPEGDSRLICPTCYSKAIEKLLGIYNEAEWVLYEK